MSKARRMSSSSSLSSSGGSSARKQRHTAGIGIGIGNVRTPRSLSPVAALAASAALGGGGLPRPSSMRGAATSLGLVRPSSKSGVAVTWSAATFDDEPLSPFLAGQPTPTLQRPPNRSSSPTAAPGPHTDSRHNLLPSLMPSQPPEKAVPMFPGIGGSVAGSGSGSAAAGQINGEAMAAALRAKHQKKAQRVLPRGASGKLAAAMRQRRRSSNESTTAASAAASAAPPAAVPTATVAAATPASEVPGTEGRQGSKRRSSRSSVEPAAAASGTVTLLGASEARLEAGSVVEDGMAALAQRPGRRQRSKRRFTGPHAQHNALTARVYGLQRRVPARFVCPLTHLIMSDPVGTIEGVVYERAALEAWWATHELSAVTGFNLGRMEVRPMRTLRQEIQEYLKANPEVAAAMTDWARWQFLDMVVRCRQDEVFATKPRPQATGPRGWNNTFNVSDDVRMFMTRIQMQQYLPVFAEWGFDEMASLARIEKKHLADMRMPRGHMAVILHALTRVRRLEEMRYNLEDKRQERAMKAASERKLARRERHKRSTYKQKTKAAETARRAAHYAKAQADRGIRKGEPGLSQRELQVVNEQREVVLHGLQASQRHVDAVKKEQALRRAPSFHSRIMDRRGGPRLTAAPLHDSGGGGGGGLQGIRE